MSPCRVISSVLFWKQDAHASYIWLIWNASNKGWVGWCDHVSTVWCFFNFDVVECQRDVVLIWFMMTVIFITMYTCLIFYVITFSTTSIAAPSTHFGILPIWHDSAIFQRLGGAHFLVSPICCHIRGWTSDNRLSVSSVRGQLWGRHHHCLHKVDRSCAVWTECDL